MNMENTCYVDTVDADLFGLGGWCAWKHPSSKTFYAVRSIRKPDGSWTQQRLHQVIAQRMGIVGAPDHKDRNGLNNRRNNLRQATSSQNVANQSLRSNNTSGYKGVSWDKASGKWVAKVKVNGKQQQHLGLFSDPIEAAKTYDRAALKAFGDFAFLNFPN